MKYSRRFFILIATTIFLAQCTSKEAETSKAEVSPPNIIFVLVDDMRWDEFGAAGHVYLQTPNIDRIANEGAWFKNAFSTMPLCSPSRAGFLTGLYAHSNGIEDNLARNEQSHKLRTFPAKLDTLGYETAFIGKWHMGNDDSRRPGFNRWVALKGQGEATNPKLNIDGERKVVKGYTTDILTDFALEFINKKRDEPFLLYLSHKALHPNFVQHDDGSVTAINGGGFVAADRHKGMYKDKIFTKRPNFGIAPTDKPALARKINDLPLLSEKTVTPENTIRERAEMLMGVDDGLGKMLKALKASGQLDNTVVVVTSDHGYWYGEHGLSEERRLAYEEAIRIPLLIRYPAKIKAGSKIEQTALSLDLAPTLIDLAGQSVDKHFQGRSLVPLFSGPVTNWRTSFLIEYYSDHVFERIVDMGYKAVRTDRYKYIHYLDLDNMDEFYDLQEDPYELHNLIGDPDASQAINEMKAELEKLLAETDYRD
jgi:arylsulfatase A-like enzyme